MPIEQNTSETVAERHRLRIWEALRRVGRPDSRFHWDFSSFIADFDDNDLATERVRALDAWQRTDRVFITPDNSTERLRRAAVRDGKALIVTTYGIRRGFMEIRPRSVPGTDVNYAATLDGLDVYGEPRTLAQLRTEDPIPLLITGGSAVSSNGIRFGKGHGYFDLEWAMLAESELVTEDAEIVDIVHDEQFVDEPLAGEKHDVPVDWVVTPTRTIRINVDRAPGRILWEMIPGTEHETIPPIQELAALRERA